MKSKLFFSADIGTKLWFVIPGIEFISMSSISLLLLIIVFAFPIIFLITYSFWTQDYVTIDKTLTLENYKTVINKLDIFKYYTYFNH